MGLTAHQCIELFDTEFFSSCRHTKELLSFTTLLLGKDIKLIKTHRLTSVITFAPTIPESDGFFFLIDRFDLKRVEFFFPSAIGPAGHNSSLFYCSGLWSLCFDFFISWIHHLVYSFVECCEIRYTDLFVFMTEFFVDFFGCLETYAIFCDFCLKFSTSIYEVYLSIISTV